MTSPRGTSLTGARTGVVSWLKQELNAPATPAREAECASATFALCEQIVALDMTLEPIVARFGGKAPVADQWRAGQPAVRGTEGTWGTVEGELAQTCTERAMRKFGRILHLLMVEIGGAPEPANADLGLEALAQAAEVLKPSLRVELLNEAFSKLATGHRARRLSPAAPAVDGEAIFYRAKAQVPGMLANSQSAESGVQSGKEAGKAAAEETLLLAGAKRGSDRPTACSACPGRLRLPRRPRRRPRPPIGFS